jgi:hypothetical protein
MSNQGKSMYPPDVPPYYYDTATRTIRNEFNFVAGAVRPQNAHFLVRGANGYWETRKALEAARERERAQDEAITYIRSLYPEDVFLPESDSEDAKLADMARRTCDNIRREIGERLGALAAPTEVKLGEEKNT